MCMIELRLGKGMCMIELRLGNGEAAQGANFFCSANSMVIEGEALEMDLTDIFITLCRHKVGVWEGICR